MPITAVRIKKGAKQDQQTEETDILTAEILRDHEHPETAWNETGYFHRGGSFYTFDIGKKGKSSKILSNFLFEILYHFNDGSNNTRRLIKLQHNKGKISTVEVLSSETSPDKFETILKSRQCSFFGSGYDLKVIFANLMNFEREAIFLQQYGQSPEHNIYIFSDGIISNNKFLPVNNIGIIQDDNRCFYLPAWAQSNLFNNDYAEARKFRLRLGELTFKTYADLLIKAYGLNAVFGLSYLISSIFRDIVIKETGSFPFLFLFGQAGTGKTTYIDFIMSVFGDKDAGTPLIGSTGKGIARTLSQKQNALNYWKEFTNKIPDDIKNLIKNAYDGTAYTIAQKSADNSTSTFLVKNGIIVDGNELPTYEAPALDRFIILNFQNNTFTPDNLAAKNALSDLVEKGAGGVLMDILKQREFVQEMYKTTYRDTLASLRAMTAPDGTKVNSLPERNIKHISFIWAMILLLKERLKIPLTKEQMKETLILLIEDAIEKNDMLNETKDVSIFWDAINHERNRPGSRINEGSNYTKDIFDKILYLKIGEVYPFYCQYCQQTGAHWLDRTTLQKLLSAQSYFKKGEQRGRGNDYIKKGFGSCYRFIFSFVPDDDSKIQIGDKILNL